MTAKQQAFVREYLIDLNATQACIRAGYATSNAHKIGHQLLGKSVVADAISAGMAKRAKKLDISADKVLEKIAQRAFTGFSKYVRIDGSGQPVMDLSGCSKDELDCITELNSEVVIEQDGHGDDATLERVRKTKIKIGSQDKNLELLARHLGLLNDKLDVTSGGKPFKALVSVDIDAV